MQTLNFFINIDCFCVYIFFPKSKMNQSVIEIPKFIEMLFWDELPTGYSDIHKILCGYKLYQ